MMRTKHNHGTLLWLLVSALVLAGCSSPEGSTTYLNEGITPGPGTHYLTIKVFSSREVGFKYEELGSVSAAIHGEVQSNKFLDMIRKEAAKLGADAVVAYEQWGTTATGVAVRAIKRGPVP
ncbi:MAG: hypothetical protein KAJ12_01310 [Bacteroidetes bacterium]|nr:hypothetical protein [Bacteroidota bacterium]